MVSYTKLKTRSFINRIVNNPNVSEVKIMNALEECYKNCAFSTFPYIMHNIDSREAIKKYNSGNCVALSIYVKDYLKTEYGIKSYLIPATIPNKYKQPQFLEISHVALAIPKNKELIYVADPAFYFLNPLQIDLTDYSPTIVYSKSIYSREYMTDLKDYTTIDRIICQTKKLTNSIKYNEYQTIPKDTIISEVFYQNDPNDKWSYFLREIVKPDKSISDFYIQVKNEPFITPIYIDKNGICRSKGYFSLTNSGNVRIAKEDYPREDYNIYYFPNDKIMEIDKITRRFFKNNLTKYLEHYKNLQK